MSTARPLLQAVYADSRTPFRMPIVWQGQDLLGATLTGEVRASANQDDAMDPLEVLTFSPMALTTIDGVECSQSIMSLDVSQVLALAETAGEDADPDADIELWYDVHMDFNTLVTREAGGKFVLTAGVTND